jgi:hypothetical protein
MKGAAMDGTLKGLRARLAGFDGDLPVVFSTDKADISGGYHLTELKHLTVSSIDCEGNRRAWTEARMELLDGTGGDLMPLAKLIRILDQSAAAIPLLNDVPLSVEFAPGNRGLRHYALGGIEANGERLRIALTDGQAQCKPRAERAAGAEASCCV